MKRDIRLNWQGLVEEAIKRRKAQRLTQEQLAVLAGVSKLTVNAFEQGKLAITLEKAVQIFKVLGMA